MGNTHPSAPTKQVDWERQVKDALKAANINANMQAALEHHPEAFAPVSMLFVKMSVNGHRLNGFVDSGAQSTIISKRVAEQCGIGQLIDERFGGVARGVGTGKILGRIHAVIVAVGRQHLSCALTVMEGDIGPDVIFGLDMLKRHQVHFHF
jgi:DNA damage-inducible protein 1